MKSPTQMFLEDHARIRELLETFEQARDDEARQQLIARSFAEIAIHEALRQELVVPPIREALGDSSVADWAACDYEKQTHPMEDIAATHSASERVAKFKGFAEAVKRELAEEEQRLVPKFKEIESKELGELMANRRKELERVRLFL
jgi:hemerythrin-like domain-containing protein